MESIFPDLPWYPSQQICDLPQAQLIYAIILKAWEDSNKKFPCPIRNKARAWFKTKRFEYLCQLVGLPDYEIYKYANEYWRENAK